jgi:CO dehydrogenase maturation factor
MKLLICGKGGCGKSTVTALLAGAMGNRGKKVFVVDADESNIGLYRMLGLDFPTPLMDHLGGKKGFRQKTSAAGTGLGGPPRLFPDNMPVESLPDACVSQKENIRVMPVGKIHHFGEGCACPMGNLFRMLFSSLDLAGQDLVIIDTAAGVEHFGRRLEAQCDRIICVADPSYESIMMTQRVATLASEAGLPVNVVLNKIDADIEDQMAGAIADIPILGRLPNDKNILFNNLNGVALDPAMPEIQGLCDAVEAFLS